VATLHSILTAGGSEMANEKVKEIMHLDLRDPKNENRLRNALVKVVKPLANHNPEDVTVCDVEEVLTKISEKYQIGIGYILANNNKDGHYSMMLKCFKTHEHIDTVYAKTLFEGVSKSAIRLVAYEKSRR
jgi:hypothetical protein